MHVEPQFPPEVREQFAQALGEWFETPPQHAAVAETVILQDHRDGSPVTRLGLLYDNGLFLIFDIQTDVFRDLANEAWSQMIRAQASASPVPGLEDLEGYEPPAEG